jgi:hypothetical protein
MNLLRPGESRREVETIRWMIIHDIRPETNIEWLWTLDLVEFSWEIHRDRCLKKDPRRIGFIVVELTGIRGADRGITGCSVARPPRPRYDPGHTFQLAVFQLLAGSGRAARA